MSRAIRRQAAATPKKAPTKTPSLGTRRARPTRGARPVQERRPFRLGVPAWMSDIVSELRKVTWPTRDETVYLSTVVIIVALAVGIFLGIIDIFFNWLMDRILLG
jgi:preprotein translocase subunit SecE